MKKVLVALPLLVVAVVAAILIPAHIQIRGVQPILPTPTELRSVLATPGGPSSLSFIDVGSQVLSRGVLGHSVFLLEWPDGKLFMIDAGMDEAAAVEFGELLETLDGGDTAVFNAAAADVLGEQVSNVHGVGFTHLHVDHTQGIEAFCTARGEGAKVFQASWQAALANLHTKEGAERVASSCLEQETLLGEGVLSVPGFPGLAAVGLGGHTPGSTLFVAAVDGKLWLFSGDITNTKDAILNNTGKGFLYSNFIVPEDTARTEKLRLWLAEFDLAEDMEVVVSHDLEAIKASGIAAFPFN